MEKASFSQLWQKLRESNTLSRLWHRFRTLIDLSDYIDVEASAINIRSNIAFRGPNILILFCAIIIASVGLNVNSIPVIIGAMLISPLMSPIVGMGLALGTNDTDLLRHALKNLGIMVGISILASTLYFLLSPLDMEHPTELLARTNPTIYDVMIALFGGFAGIVETSRKEKGTVVSGVAIATALMPPLCTVGYGLASFQPQFFLGALYLFFINTAFIALAAFIGTKYLGYKRLESPNPAAQRKQTIIISIALVLIIIPSIISGVAVIQENNFSRNVNTFVSENKSIGKSYIYDYKVHNETKPTVVEIFVAGEALSAEDYDYLYRQAEKYGMVRAQIDIHQDAAFASLSEKDIFQEVLRSNEDRLAARDQQIANMQQELDSLHLLLKTNHLPTEQILAEAQTQYEHLSNLLLASCGTDANRQVIALVEHDGKTALSPEELQKLSKWLKVRLGVEDLRVVQE